MKFAFFFWVGPFCYYRRKSVMKDQVTLALRHSNLHLYNQWGLQYMYYKGPTINDHVVAYVRSWLHLPEIRLTLTWDHGATYLRSCWHLPKVMLTLTWLTRDHVGTYLKSCWHLPEIMLTLTWHHVDTYLTSCWHLPEIIYIVTLTWNHGDTYLRSWWHILKELQVLVSAVFLPSGSLLLFSADPLLMLGRFQ